MNNSEISCNPNVNITVKEVLGENYQLLLKLADKLDYLNKDISGEETPKQCECACDGMLSAVKEQNRLITYCIDKLDDTANILGI